MAKNDFQYGGWNSYTLQCGMIVTLIFPGDCTAACNVACGFGIMTVNSPKPHDHRLRLLVLTHYQRVTNSGTGRQIDSRTDRHIAYSDVAL